jgi:hypothetical protein
MELFFSADISAAAWVQEEVGEFGSGVQALLPKRFEHYARLLHPARDSEFNPVSWADVAAWSGREAHSHAQFMHLSRPKPGFGVGPKPWSVDPDDGDPGDEVLSPLRQILARHTQTPDQCWFCLWEGWGQLNEGASGVQIALSPDSTETREEVIERLGIWTGAAIPPEVIALPRVELPQRDYFLLSGPLNAIVDREMVAGASDEGHPGIEFVSQPPSIFWPEDKSWCVATEIDLDSTFVAGSAELIADVLDDPSLETWPARPEDRIDWAADEINSE